MRRRIRLRWAIASRRDRRRLRPGWQDREQILRQKRRVPTTKACPRRKAARFSRRSGASWIRWRRRSSGAWPIRKSRWPEYWSDGVMACWGPEFLASLHDSSTPSFQPDLLVREIFDVNALPDLARNAMARRVSGEGRLGCGIDAPLCGVAVFLGRGVEIGPASI